MSRTFVNVLRSLHSHSSGRVKVYGEQLTPFGILSGVQQRFPASTFLFNYIIEGIMENSLGGWRRPGEC